MAKDKIDEAISLSDRTGLGDSFSYKHYDEITQKFVVDPDDFSGIEMMGESKEPQSISDKFFVGLDLTGIEVPRPTQELRSNDNAKKGLFETMFGYNPNNDLPLGYRHMTPIQRLAYKAQLSAKNIATRIGLGAAYQAKGLLQLVLPESVEQYLVDDKQIREGRLPEDQYYEKRVQKELLKKQSEGELTAAEKEHLDYLNESLPSGMQRAPEFIGRVVAEIEKIALASEVFGAIPVGKNMTLANFLSKKGKSLVGDKLVLSASTMVDKPVKKIALESLAKTIEQIGPSAGELFTWGVISEETIGDNPVTDRLAAGAKMIPWSLIAFLFVPAKMAGATKMGESVKSVVKSAVLKATIPINKLLATMQSDKAKSVFINKVMSEADDLMLDSHGRILNGEEKTELLSILGKIADDTTGIAKKNADDITSAMELMAGKELSKQTIANESIIPQSLRSVESVADDVINNASVMIEKRTGYAVVRQGNGNYAILDKSNQYEVSVNIKRKDLAKELDDAIFGVNKNKPKVNPLDKTTKKQTKRTIVEEVELKKVLHRLEVATSQAYKAGVKSAKEKAAEVLAGYKERINTIRYDNKVKWQNVELARSLVKDLVPKEDQHLFMSRLIKAKTDGKLSGILDDINKHLEKKRVNNAVDMLRESLGSLRSKYKTKGGKFAAAPDHIRPILESLDSINSSISKRTNTITGEVDDLASLFDDMISGVNGALAGRGEVLGLPEAMIDDLYNLKTYKPGVAASDIEAISNLAKIILHRAEQAESIKLNGLLTKAAEVVDDSILRVVPRNIKPDKGGVLSSLKTLVTVDSDHPATLITKLFGENSKAMTLLDDLYAGETLAYGVQRESYRIVKDYLRANDISDDIFNQLNKSVNIKVGGKSIEVSRGDVLSLAMSARDPFVFDQLTTTRGIKLGGQNIPRLTTDELADAISMLSETEMKLGGVFFHLNNTYLSNIVNKTSVELNGVKLATYPQYFPSHRVLDLKIYGNKYSMKTAETQSNFMPRIGGTGNIRINNFSKELMDYIQNVSMYHGTAVPMRSIKTVFANKNLQDVVRQSGHEKELANFLEILGRSEGMYSDSSVIDLIGQKALNKFTKAALGGRVSTVGTQVCSVPAAGPIIPSKYFKSTDIKTLDDDLMSVSDFFWHRWQGGRVSIEVGDVAAASNIEHFVYNKTPISEKGLSMMIWGDKLAISKIHAASKRMIADTTKLTGVEAEVAAAKLTEKATRLTQPNWGPLTRSRLATDSSVFKRTFTMFRTAQEAQLNVLKRANVIFQRSPKSLTDWKSLGESYKAVVKSQANVAIWKALWKHGRKAVVTGVMGWLGVKVIDSKDSSVVDDLALNAVRTASDTFPLGRQVEGIVENAITSAAGGNYVNTSQDPISTIQAAASQSMASLGKWIDRYYESKKQREGYTVDFMPTSIDDLLNEITESQADKADAKRKLYDDLTKDIVTAIKAVGLITGTPIAPIDEFVEPALRRSKYSKVARINGDNSSNPMSLARDLDKFLTLKAELQQKSDSDGLTESESQLALMVNVINKTYVEPLFAIIDTDAPAGKILDVLADELDNFFKNSKAESPPQDDKKITEETEQIKLLIGD